MQQPTDQSVSQRKHVPGQYKDIALVRYCQGCRAM